MKETAGTIAQSFADSFKKLIEEAPEGDGLEIVAPTSKPCLVRPGSGWDSRYVEEVELIGDEWRRAFTESRDIVSKAGIVAYLGTRGSGKTRMAAEIARDGYWPTDKGEWNGNAIVSGKTALYRRAMDVFLELRDCNKKGASRSEKDVLETLASSGLLVIDEFQERGETDWENRIICNLLDKRYATHRPTILIANYSVDEMKKALSPSVRDRMRECGKAFVFNWQSYRKQP